VLTEAAFLEQQEMEDEEETYIDLMPEDEDFIRILTEPKRLSECWQLTYQNLVYANHRASTHGLAYSRMES